MAPRRNLLKKALLLLAVILLVAWLAYSVSTPSQGPAEPSTSSSSTNALTASNFQIEILNHNLVYNSSTSLYALRVDFQVTNNLNVEVHYINATIFFVNYTLSNGAVLQPPPFEAKRTETKANFGITYPISLTFTVGTPGSNANLRDVKLIFLVYVAELSSPLYLPQDIALTS